eukprot:4543037-Pyramimonas_sp.AAC.1
MTRDASLCWRRHVEFVAAVFNAFLRRDQMASVEAHVKSTRNDGVAGATPEQAQTLAQVSAEGLLSSAVGHKRPRPPSAKRPGPRHPKRRPANASCSST